MEWLIEKLRNFWHWLFGREPAQPSLPPRPTPIRAVQDKLIQIGLDFGTSGTKVVYRDLQMGVSRPMDFNHRLKGYPSYVLPSTVTIEGGKVFFGIAAEERSGSGQVFRSFKICLACQVRVSECRKCEHRLGNSERGVFRVGTGGGALVIDAQQLATWYLAYVIGKAHAAIRERWPEPWRLKVWVNVGAPIDQYQGKIGKEGFTKAAYYAEKLSDEVRDGVPIQLLVDEHQRISWAYPTIPDGSQRKVFVLQETAAGLMSFIHSPAPMLGLYAIVDVGAGTTDVSFFRLASLSQTDLCMAFYDARTGIVGADDMDRAIADLALSKLQAAESLTPMQKMALLQEARITKSSLNNSDGLTLQVGERAVFVSRQELEPALKPACTQMLEIYRKTNHAAFQKESLVERWRSYTLFFLGGGTRMDLLRSAFSMFRPSGYNREITPTQLSAPEDFEASPKTRADFDLLAIAYGLSHPAVDFPKIYNPSEVNPMELRIPVRPRLDRDELYPER